VNFGLLAVFWPCGLVGKYHSFSIFNPDAEDSTFLRNDFAIRKDFGLIPIAQYTVLSEDFLTTSNYFSFFALNT
jgi:hypothetical protein